MEFLTSAGAKIRGRKLLCFAGNTISIAIHNRRDAFEYTEKQLMDLERLRTAQRADIRELTGILDELMQNDHLFPR